ncbi:MAG: 16S rRNA (adenine(1518)-N(6)/adenine(1519)-N(6))-dimethyltransferase RsmA [Desulfuromonadaceae bacterium]|nr:16S rRNA (adenine(1518)-N(6)/adenine(1519)-N(6))-dimethyltransferase RsmA [Desulfuromonadaceae bacterium]MDD5105844.1 16S rRNA (adenine(1518)-N(6)/adenine(1519)-N(6))-dimethyltransferase RsmA [Desulfuromonadaceae bacterium]
MCAARRPLKSLGQNFLVDQNVIDKIIQAAHIQPDQPVLEIGPGRGALTKHLAKRGGRLVLVEFDHALAAFYRDQHKDNSLVTVIDADVLKVDLDTLLSETSAKWNVVANLPYNISTEVLFRLYAVHNRLARMTLMLQKEVGDRLAAPPDCSAYGVTTVLLGLWFDISRVFIVHPGSFHPSPKVDSVVLNFIPRPEPRAEVGDEDVFRTVVKSAFAMRRKTLANCLKSTELAKTVDWMALLEVCAIDGRRRGETLSLEEFALLSRHAADAVHTDAVRQKGEPQGVL